MGGIASIIARNYMQQAGRGLGAWGVEGEGGGGSGGGNLANSHPHDFHSSSAASFVFRCGRL